MFMECSFLLLLNTLEYYFWGMIHHLIASYEVASIKAKLIHLSQNWKIGYPVCSFVDSISWRSHSGWNSFRWSLRCGDSSWKWMNFRDLWRRIFCDKGFPLNIQTREASMTHNFLLGSILRLWTKPHENKADVWVNVRNYEQIEHFKVIW